jgi:hypothetical protein
VAHPYDLLAVPDTAETLITPCHHDWIAQFD